MKKILVLDGSMRKNGNTSFLVQHFLDGAKENNAQTEHLLAAEANIKHCTGCLRCNMIKHCSLTNDDWENISQKILEADVLVFASPIYFHHLTSPLKTIIDRFRSFIHVQITKTGLVHTPWQQWKKDFVLLLSMGSPDDIEGRPVVDLFNFMTGMLGSGNQLHVIKATRLAVARQITKTEEELKELYPKLKLPGKLASTDYQNNQNLLKECHKLGFKLSK